MTEKNSIHYYSDTGDVILQAENTHFLVHKLNLSFASEFFNDLFTHGTPGSSTEAAVKTDSIVSSTETSSEIPIIMLNDENAKTIEDVLSFIYPNTFIRITWENVEEMLRLADKFFITKLTKTCESFLENDYNRNYLLSFQLADRYRLRKVFKESSKLVLDGMEEYRYSEHFQELSINTRMKMLDSGFRYYSGFGLLEQNNEMKKQLVVVQNTNRYFQDIFKSLNIYPQPRPSAFWEKFKSKIGDLEGRNSHISNGVQKFLGKFEPLEIISDGKMYLFIELD
ncbi:2684_t:CDS:1 [Acaulospora morrowiae]|uniref:2684_t:CDS:1 n=1 Tax=Acaulospora morrowiae TaxID=94023 RepID=A0A9N9D2W9_9GLOM|nr:2684_t:CDS:1 [Acaulospora morrowiae]